MVEVGPGMEREVRMEAGRNVVVLRQQIMSRDVVAEMAARLVIAIFPRRMMTI